MIFVTQQPQNGSKIERLTMAQEHTIQNLKALGWFQISQDKDFCLVQSWQTPPFLLMVAQDGGVVPMKPTMAYA